ncbi:MAG: desulfoferrodoxin [Spirochaetia bacterium]|nr:desulfoferrodoxin [Spirochaetia bacterium]
MKFYRCARCGQIMAVVKNTGVPVICCGQPMNELIPGTVDASREKHVPVYEVKGDKVYVTVGSAAHPMTEEHYIEWISIQTECGNQRKALKPGMEPKVCFSICPEDRVIAVYAYCNLHSLWKA